MCCLNSHLITWAIYQVNLREGERKRKREERKEKEGERKRKREERKEKEGERNRKREERKEKEGERKRKREERKKERERRKEKEGGREKKGERRKERKRGREMNHTINLWHSSKVNVHYSQFDRVHAGGIPPVVTATVLIRWP